MRADDLAVLQETMMFEWWTLEAVPGALWEKSKDGSSKLGTPHELFFRTVECMFL